MRYPARLTIPTLALASLCVAQPTAAHEIAAEAGTAEDAAFDIVQARVTAEALWLTFQMRVSGDMGASIPTPVGELAGAPVYAYVWPTDLNSSVVGFEPDQGILALAVTSHPDFDDTPLFDEDGDGNPDNDGHVWHTHWVVLTPDEENCPGGLKVRDIPDGETPQVPLTWPGMPLLIDSPGYSPLVIEDTLSVRVPFRDAPDLKGVAFDAVTAGLRVNRNLDAPLLCVENVFDVASGDLSLPGRVE